MFNISWASEDLMRRKLCLIFVFPLEACLPKLISFKLRYSKHMILTLSLSHMIIMCSFSTSMCSYILRRDYVFLFLWMKRLKMLVLGKIYCNLFALLLWQFMEMEIKREAAESFSFNALVMCD